MTQEQKAKLKSLAVNALIMASAAAITVFLEALQQADFGTQTPFVVAIIGVFIKGIQAFTGRPASAGE